MIIASKHEYLFHLKNGEEIPNNMFINIQYLCALQRFANAYIKIIFRKERDAYD